MEQFDFIESKTGTRIVIFNLRKSGEDPDCQELEMDFESKSSDILLRRDVVSFTINETECVV